jgi:hypothetical protein
MPKESFLGIASLRCPSGICRLVKEAVYVLFLVPAVSIPSILLRSETLLVVSLMVGLVGPLVLNMAIRLIHDKHTLAIVPRSNKG